MAKIYVSFVDRSNYVLHQQLTLVSSFAVSEDILPGSFVAFVNVFEHVLWCVSVAIKHLSQHYAYIQASHSSCRRVFPTPSHTAEVL